jgi:hypothetical protein
LPLHFFQPIFGKTLNKTLKRYADFGLDGFGRTEAHAGNSRLPQWGLTWLIEVQCFYREFVQVDSSMFINPPLRKAP